ncbi:MAG TPA: COX15/CtaA family protein [Pyrinomonadaceae bacterium]
MSERAKMSAFAKYAWFALGYNVLVIVWGVFLRASKSGDGCGQYWLTCNGELIPSAPQFATVIEFSHRMTTAIDGFVMLVLLGWAIKIFLSDRSTQSRQVLYAAIGSFIFVLTEAAVGAGLVLTGNVAEAVTDTRPLWAMGHLINTFILLTFLTVTAWFAAKPRKLRFSLDAKTLALIALGVVGLLFVGISGSLAALSNMLFPSQTLAEGVAKDFSPTSDLILRLRLSHPILSILTSVYLIFLAGWLKAKSGDATVTWWSNAVSLLVVGQVIFGGATLLTLGPIIMQLGHLLLADAVWIAFVLLVANYVSHQSSEFHV